MPVRIQLKRAKGWRKPEGAIVCSRPGPWGNPYPTASAFSSVFDRIWISVYGNHALPDMHLDGERRARVKWMVENIHLLKNADLCCWCKPEDSCHVDVLLEYAEKLK